MNPRQWILFAAFSLFLLGILLIFSTTSAEMIDHGLEKSRFSVVIKQLSYAVVGLGLALAISQKGYLFMMRWSRPLFWLLILSLVLVLVPGVGKVVNGSRRWLGIGNFTFQPSEFVKIILPLYLIPRLLSLDKSSLVHFFRLMAVSALPILLILVEPNTGTAGVIALTTLALLFLTKIPFRFWALPLFAALIVGVGFAANLDYVQRRLQVYLHPESDLKGKGHQPYQAKIAIGRGGLLGQGPGMSRQKLSYLPEAQNDYIAAIYAEEFGFIGILGLLLLYFLFVLGALGVALQASDPKGALIAATIAFLFAFQAFLNLGVVSGLLPSTGLNLPLFSQGGSSLIANICGIALLLTVIKEKTTCVS